MNSNNAHEYSVDDLKNIKKSIEKLQENEHYEIIKILNKHNFKYSENNNGVFINMNRLSNTIILDILKFIEFCKKNKQRLEIDIAERKSLINSFIKN